MTDLEKRLNKLRSGEKQTTDYPYSHLSPVVSDTAPKSSLSSRLEQLRAENGVSQQAAQTTVSNDEYRKARNDIQIAKNTGDGEALEKAKERFRSLGGDPDTNVIKAQATRTGSDLLSAAAYITRANPLDSKTDKAAQEYKPNERAFNYLTGKADELSERAAQQTESLKKGRTAAGQALVDIGMQGAQLAADAVANAALPGSGMASLAARSFGGAATEARQAGATVNQQKLYGLANAGVELLTEKLSGIMNIGYGKGAADKAVDYFIGKLSNSEAGQAAWRLLFSSLGEGAEEAISDLVNPITKAIYNGRKVKENYSELKGAEVAYDAFIGAVLGFFGGSVEGLTGNVSEEAKFFRNAHDSGLSFKEATNAWAAVEAANRGAQTQEAPEGENIQPTEETAAESENEAPQTESQPAPEAQPEQTAQPEAESQPAQPTAEQTAPAPDVAPTQNTASPDIAPTQNTQFERLGQEQTYHTIRHDKTVEAEAAAMLKGRSTESVISELAKKGAWNDTDTAAAGKLAEQLVTKINTGKGADAAVSELARLRTALEAKVGNAARVLRMRGRRPGTVADFVSDAAKQISGQKLRNGATKEGICKTVAEYAERYSGISQNKTAESTQKLKDLILDVSDTRNTSGGKNGKAQRELIANAIDKVATQKGGYEFLRDLATVQIRSIAGDYVDRGFINKLKAVRYLNLLSNPVTTHRNVGANTVFANFMETAGNNGSFLVDAFLGALTGNGRTVAFDRGLFSEAFQKGFSEASVRAFLEITLDAESGKANSKYDEIRGSTFKKTGNWLERYFAEIEKLQGYALKLTDEAQKGGTRAEISRGANALYDAAKRAKTGVTSNDIAEMADETAKYRTLQNESKTATLFQDIRLALNKFSHIGNEKTGTFGLGDALAPFAKVPANAVSSTAAVNPIYAAANAVRLVDILFDVANGKQVSAKKQANTAKSIGRNLNGIGLTVLASVLSAKGVIRNSDDEDRDANALEKSIGKTGAQINLSAAKRWIEGNGSAEWKPDDTVIALGWLPQLNAILIMGDALYNAYSDEDGLTAEEVINASFKTLFQTFMDFPAVSSISNLIDAFKYSTAENYGGKLKDVGVQFAGDIGTSFAVSNAVAAVARGMDGVERDVYSADTVAEKERNILFSKIPFLRETLPPSLDNFGNEIYTEEQVLNFLNSILLPGKIGTVKDNKAANEVLRLYEATEKASTIPDKNPPSSISVKGESHRLTTAEKRAFKETYGQTAQNWISDVMNTGTYKELEDADKAEVITDILSYAKSKATEEYCRKNGIAYSSEYVALTQGVDKPGTANDKTALKPSEVPNYLLFKSAWGKATESGDTAAVDRLVRQFNSTASQTLKAAESERIDGVKALVNASKLGVKSADVLAVDKTIESFQADGDRNQPNGSDKFKGLMYANVSDKTRDALAETYLTKERYLAYQYLRGQDVPPKDIYRVFTEIDSNDNGTLSKKECQAAGYNALYEYIKAK